MGINQHPGDTLGLITDLAASRPRFDKTVTNHQLGGVSLGVDW